MSALNTLLDHCNQDAVLPSSWNRFAAVGARRVELGVRADNALAIALYRSLGFVEARRLPGRYPSDGMDGLEMIGVG